MREAALAGESDAGRGGRLNFLSAGLLESRTFGAGTRDLVRTVIHATASDPAAVADLANEIGACDLPGIVLRHADAPRPGDGPRSALLETLLGQCDAASLRFARTRIDIRRDATASRLSSLRVALDRVAACAATILILPLVLAVAAAA